MIFKYNEETENIELGDTGKVVAKPHSNISNMLIPDVDPSIGAKVALHVFNGINRVHDIKFGAHTRAAELLTAGGFDEPKKQDLFHDSHSLTYNEYSDTIRVKETNHLLMAKNPNTDQWEFNFDSGAPEQLAQQSFLRFHANPSLRNASPDELLAGLNSKPVRQLEHQDPSYP